MTHSDQHDTVSATGSPVPDDTRLAPEPKDDRLDRAKHAETPRAQSSPRDRRRRRLRCTTAVGAVLVVVTFIVVIFAVSTNVIIKASGPTWNVLDNGSSSGQDVLKVSGTEAYPTQGALRVAAASVSGCPNYPVTTVDLITTRFLADKRIVDRNEVRPQDQNTEQVEEIDKAQMTASQDSAVIATLVETDKAGAMHLTVTEVAEQQTSTEIQAGNALETTTPENSQITAITSFSQLGEFMTTVAEDTRVALGVCCGGQQVVAALITITLQGGAAGSLLGPNLRILMGSKVDATFGLSSVGGPGVGMMLTLGVVDEIIPGALTGGEDISGIGTIDINGQVGPIGGAQQKMADIRKASSTCFLTSVGNCDEVGGHEPEGMQVLAASTLHKAITAAQAIASGDTSSLATCPAR